MNVRSLRRLTTVAALALATMAAAAACTSAGTVEPLTDTAGAASPSATSPTPATPLPTNPKPAQIALSPTTGSQVNPVCLGAVVHRIDASDTGPPWKQRCITVGGELLVANLGPDGFSASSWNNVGCNYAGGVHSCRLLHTGTVKFTVDNGHQTRTLTLVIAKASTPPKPSPACMAAGTKFTIDAANGGPPSWPVCMKMSNVVRVVNLGPEGFSVRPSNAVTCSYAAAVRSCRFTGPETVTFTTSPGDAEPRTQTVVAIR
jgi:hypothetical protein